jgi:hypothetical protein
MVVLVLETMKGEAVDQRVRGVEGQLEDPQNAVCMASTHKKRAGEPTYCEMMRENGQVDKKERHTSRVGREK